MGSADSSIAPEPLRVAERNTGGWDLQQRSQAVRIPFLRHSQQSSLLSSVDSNLIRMLSRCYSFVPKVQLEMTPIRIDRGPTVSLQYYTYRKDDGEHSALR